MTRATGRSGEKARQGFAALVDEQALERPADDALLGLAEAGDRRRIDFGNAPRARIGDQDWLGGCLLYTSDAADE